MSLRVQLRGTGVAIVTPFQQDYSVDYTALEKLIDFVIANGVEYIVSLGTTGETPTLNKEEKKQIAEFTYEKVNGRVPVVIGIGGNNTLETIGELKSFPLKEAIAVLSVSPYYSKPSQEGLFQHYQALADASPKPVLLYNVPGRTGKNLAAGTTLRLSEHENIAGIKEASGDLAQAMEILKHRPEDFLVTSGDDLLGLPFIAVGGDGVISVIANCMPAQYANLVRLSLDNNFTEAREINNDLLEVYDLLFAENNPAGVKSFLSHMDLIQNVLRLPVLPLSEPLHNKTKLFLKRQLERI
ncbi:MAG: 4-hydroxy-tetrahydrodipicolinate synthase [Chitinophagaceae bacterium]|nr:4-hydroxy-tetrahydrodipicolinate synthase [Chitinophagaceae bacterium]MCW5927435.1 4-hydroxy-tetrahydrodipicolinate synthase [Chitinophagaceae bacterium]